jgi:hypothetical protein
LKGCKVSEVPTFQGFQNVSTSSEYIVTLKPLNFATLKL